MKRFLVAGLAVVFTVSFAGLSLAADEKAITGPKSIQRTMPPGQKTPARMPMMSNFSMLYGTVSKIDDSDPAKIKVEVKNEADNTVHTVEIMPWTNVTKVTDISELKAGETVRIMARKAEDKEMAMNVMFGKIKSAPMPRASAAQAPVAPPRQKAAAKK